MSDAPEYNIEVYEYAEPLFGAKFEARVYRADKPNRDWSEMGLTGRGDTAEEALERARMWIQRERENLAQMAANRKIRAAGFVVMEATA